MEIIFMPYNLAQEGQVQFCNIAYLDHIIVLANSLSLIWYFSSSKATRHFRANTTEPPCLVIPKYGVNNGSRHITIAQVFEVWNLGEALYNRTERLQQPMDSI